MVWERNKAVKNGQEKIDRKHEKGTASICIAVVLIVLQVLLMIGGLYAGRSPHESENVSFHNAKAMVQSIVFLIGINILGIGALILSLIVWMYHKNLRGKVTAIISIIVIMINTLLVS
jgi:hypothetical protein